MGGGTEAFPDLGKHCQQPDCNQLDFLPFNCDACSKVYCVEHRSYKSHECPKGDHNSRKVMVCETCSMSMETTGQAEQDEKAILEKHEKSGDCDPNKKKKPTCPVRRCREILTFSNTTTCKVCHIKVCLKHRFPADHTCNHKSSSGATNVKVAREANDRFLVALVSRSENDCGKKSRGGLGSPPSTPSVRAY